MSTRPRVTAATIAAAATRIAGTVVLDLADLTVGPAVYLPRLEAFASIDASREDGGDLGADDGTLIVLADRVRIDALVEEHGTPGRAAEALTRELRAAGVL